MDAYCTLCTGVRGLLKGNTAAAVLLTSHSALQVRIKEMCSSRGGRCTAPMHSLILDAIPVTETQRYSTHLQNRTENHHLHMAIEN